MDYSDYENSIDQGEALELYRFSYGQGALNKFTYTDSDFTISLETDVFVPALITRKEIQVGQTLDNSTLAVTIAAESPLALMYRHAPPTSVMSLTIFACHYDPESATFVTEPRVIWVGRVLGCQPAGELAELSCDPVSTSTQRIGLRLHQQIMCPLALYGSVCRANPENHRADTSAAVVDTRAVLVPILLGDDHRGGIVQWTPAGQPTERRTILRVEPDSGLGITRLVLAGGTNNLFAGNALTLYEGCPRTLDACRDRFNNAPNYGGDPFIPYNNPHGTTSVYK